MKKSILFILFALLIPVILLAQQPPMGFTYQAVVRDLDGKPLSNQPIGVKVTLQNENGATKHYSETTTATTTSLGVVTLVVGEGVPVVGSFAAVPWELGDIYISIAVDAAGGNNYVSMGSAKLQSVPYALFTANNGAAVSGEGQAGRIAIWTDESTLSSLTALSYDNSFEVTSPSVAGDDDPIFEVKNRDGKVVFGVYQTGVRVYVDDTQVKGNRGGFAVGGFSDQIKDGGIEYLRITPDSARINVRNESKTKGNRGGFAVGGFSDQIKESPSNFLDITPENYFIGHNAGKSITTGRFNQFMGYNAGQATTSGVFNIFVGHNAGQANINGGANVFVGKDCGLYNTEGTSNVFIGHEVGYLNTTGHRNVFIGSEAGWANETGLYNVFIGSEAGFSNETGNRNVFIGNETGLSNQGGQANVYIGDAAGRFGSYASWNVFVGYQSGYNTTGTHNVFLGHSSGYSNTSGSSNNFIGQGAGYSNTTGTNNIFIGNDAGRENLSNSGNIFLGRNAGYHSTEHGNTIIGHTAGEFLATGANNTFLGCHSGEERTGGDNNLILGGYANQKGGSGSFNTIIGNLAGSEATGYGNVLLGYSAGWNEKGNNKLYIANSNTTTPLIWGDFSAKQLRFNATAVGINAAPSTNQTLLVVNPSTSDDLPAIRGIHNVKDNYGIGLVGDGGFIGVQAINNSTSGDNFGFRTSLTEPGATGMRIGVYSSVSGAATNYAGYFVGNVHVIGAFTNPSDINLKQNIKPIENAVQKIMQLNGVYFEWKPTTRFSVPDKDGKVSDGEEVSKETQVGIIAQEVEKVFPEIVFTDGKGVKSVDYTKLTPLLIQAIKEQQQTISNQNEIIETLKTQNEQIMQRLQQIEEQLNK